MTAKDFYQPKRDLLHFSKLTSTGISTDYEAVFKFAEDYYNYKTNQKDFNIGDRVLVDGVLKAKIMDVGNTRCNVKYIDSFEHEFIDVTRISF